MSKKRTVRTLRGKHGGFGKYLLAALPFILVATAVSTVMEKNGWLTPLETAALDRFLVARPTSQASHVVVVGITDQDRDIHFRGQSDPSPQNVLDLLQGIARAGPTVIGVDLGTSQEDYKNLPAQSDQPPIIWARGAELEPDKEDSSLLNTLNPFKRHEDTFTPGPVRGDVNGRAVTSGIAMAPVDSDRAIRHYERQFNVTEGSDPKTRNIVPMDSFHWAVATAYCCRKRDDPACQGILEIYDCEAKKPRDKEKADDLILNVSIDPYNLTNPISAQSVIEYLTGTPNGLDGKLKDKIVLLGGRYRAAGDEHRTAKGMEYGVDIVAQAVESEFRGGDIKRINEFGLVGLDILSGVAFAFLTYRFRQGWKRFLRLVAVPAFAIGGSYLAFHSFAIWANFAPILLSVYVHQRYEHHQEDRELREELEKARRTNQRLKRKLASLDSDKDTTDKATAVDPEQSGSVGAEQASQTEGEAQEGDASLNKQEFRETRRQDTPEKSTQSSEEQAK